MVWSEMIRLLYDQDLVTSFGQILSAHRTSTSAPDDHYIRFDDFWHSTWWDLDEFVVVTFPRFHANGYSRDSEDTS